MDKEPMFRLGQKIKVPVRLRTDEENNIHPYLFVYVDSGYICGIYTGRFEKQDMFFYDITQYEVDCWGHVSRYFLAKGVCEQALIQCQEENVGSILSPWLDKNKSRYDFIKNCTMRFIDKREQDENDKK